jgi:cyanophycin synthetase
MTVALDDRPLTDRSSFAPTPNSMSSFARWRDDLKRRRVLPIIAVAGSRGKTTVVRLLETIFTSAGLKYASWTDNGVEINGRGQTSELGAWGAALRRLASGSLDVAIQELDWPTIHAVGLPDDTYPLTIVTNVCLNNDRCLERPEAHLAIRAYDRLRQATRHDGLLVLNGDDYAVAGTEIARETPAILAGQSSDAPLLRAHLGDGGSAVWLNEETLVIGSSSASLPVVALDRLSFAWSGEATFEVQNSLLATAAAAACGINLPTIGQALGAFAMPPSSPGSFNVVPIGEALAVVDRPAPSWFLRQAIRAVKHRRHRSLVTTLGRLDQVPDDDLEEVGRLVARVSDVIIVHSTAQLGERTRALHAGFGAASGPIVLLRRSTERQALTTASARLRPGDLLLALVDQPDQALQTLRRASERLPLTDREGNDQTSSGNDDSG